METAVVAPISKALLVSGNLMTSRMRAWRLVLPSHRVSKQHGGSESRSVGAKREGLIGVRRGYSVLTIRLLRLLYSLFVLLLYSTQERCDLGLGRICSGRRDFDRCCDHGPNSRFLRIGSLPGATIRTVGSNKRRDSQEVASAGLSSCHSRAVVP